MTHWVKTFHSVKKFSLVLLLGVSVAKADVFMPADSIQHTIVSDSTPTAIKPMGLFDLNLGTTVRSARVDGLLPSGPFTNQAMGFSGRMQSSVLWSVVDFSKKKKFTWGDILAAEVFAGKLSSALEHQTDHLWVAYKFEFGLGGRFRINDHSEVGLNLILLKFSKDNVSGNISGSGILGRYRYDRFMVEGGVEARHDRVLGVLTDLQKKIPLQVTATARYLLKSGRNLGVNLETLPGIYNQDGFTYSKTWSLRIFYGIYF